MWELFIAPNFSQLPHTTRCYENLLPMLQIYFRKLGGAQVDTPDLGPVTKLGMGRRQGPVVTPPKAACTLPEFEGGGALAAELGLPSFVASPAPMGGADALESSLRNKSEAVNSTNAGPSHGADQQPPAAVAESDTGEIVGGLIVVEADMEGVAKEELEYLMKRCKRQK